MTGSKWAQKVAGLSFLGLVGAGLVASSCAEAEGRFFIECSLDPTGECTECGAAEKQVLSGTYNVAGCTRDDTGETLGTCGFDALFSVRNEMISSGSIAANHNDVETSKIIMTGADITYETDGLAIEGVVGETLLGEIDPASTRCVSARLFNNLDIAVGDVLNVVASIKIYGRTTGGLDVETPTQYFSATVYNDPGDCNCDDVEGSRGINQVPIRCADCP